VGLSPLLFQQQAAVHGSTIAQGSLGSMKWTQDQGKTEADRHLGQLR